MTRRALPASAALLAVLAISMVSALAVDGAAHAQTPSKIAIDLANPDIAKITAPDTVVIEFTDVVQVTDGTFTNLVLNNDTSNTPAKIQTNIYKIDGDSNDPDTSDNKYIGKTITLTFNSSMPVHPFVYGSFTINTSEDDFGITVPENRADRYRIADDLGDGQTGTVYVAAAQAPSVKSASILDNDTIEVVFSEPVRVKSGSFVGLTVNNLGGNIQKNPGTSTDTLRLTYSGTIDNDDNDATILLTLPGDITDHDGNSLGSIADGDETEKARKGINKMGPANPYAVVDTRHPTLESLAFTSKSAITAEFSTPVMVTSSDFTDAFTSFAIVSPNNLQSKGVDINTLAAKFVSGSNNTDTLRFTYTLTNSNGSVTADRDDIPSSLTGTAAIAQNQIKGIYGSFNYPGDNTAGNIRDGQPPVLDTANITTTAAGGSEILLKFSEPVRAEKEDFTNLRIDGAARTIDTVTPSIGPSASSPTPIATVTITIDGDDLETDSTGTIDIAATVTDNADDGDDNDATNIFNAFAGTEDQRLADKRPPTVMAKVTDLDTVTVEFSESVNATRDTFSALMIDGDGDGTNKELTAVTPTETEISRDGTTATITFRPSLDSGEFDATGKVTIGFVRDNARNMLDVTADTAIDNTDRVMNIAAGQRPDVVSAEITGPYQATIVFDEPVVAGTAHFTGLSIDHKGNSFDDDNNLLTGTPADDDALNLSVTGVSGSGTDTIVLTFASLQPASSVAEGYVTLSPAIKDMDGAELGSGRTNNAAQFVGDVSDNKLRLDDGQSILVDSAGVTAPNTVTVTFSEPPTVTKADFDNLRIAGESADREITNAVPDGNNATVTFGGDKVPTDATARIDILDTVKGKDRNNLAATAPAYAAADWQSPKLMGTPAITDSNTITVMFSEAVAASKGSFELSGDLENRTVGTVTGSGTDTLMLGFSGTTTPTDATGMLAVDPKVMDLAAAPNAFVDNTAVAVVDGQPPAIESAGITDSSKITIAFSEAVVADEDGADFANLVINGNDTRTVTDVDGSDTATLVLTFNGTAPRGATATIDVAGTINDTADNPLAAVAGLEVGADQVPMVESAAITGPNTITITFSEPVAATKAAFNGLMLSPGGDRNINDCKYGTADDAADCGAGTSSETVVLTFGGVPAASDATATINIASSVTDKQGNAIDPLTAYPIEAGQVPTVQYAKFMRDNTDTITIKFSEPVNATKSAFTGLVLSPGGPRNVEACALGNGTDCGDVWFGDTVSLTFDGDMAPQNVTATLGISGMELFDSDGNALAAVPSQYVAASQQPMLVSAGLTGPNTITMAFSERVVADADSFDDLSLAGEAAGRTVTAVSGSNTGTVTLTFGGTPAGAGATGTIDVEGLTDTAMQEIAPLRSYSVTDMQPPTVESAVITAPNVITVAFSETVTASVSSFADLMITAAGQQPTSRTVTSVNNSTEPVTARTMVVAFGGPQATTGFSGTVDIAGVTDGAGNALAPLDDLPLTVGSLGPGILSGTVYADTNDNNVRDSGEAGIAGLTVIMVDTNDVSRMFTDTTANDGTYSFDQIEFGSVLVQVAPLPPNHLPATGTLSYVMTTIEPASVTPVDFALYPVPAIQQATVSGKVYDDRNANGEFDAGTDAGLPNVPVFVVDFLTLTQTSVNTTATGDYTIAGVLPDTVLVQAHPLPYEYITHGDANSYAYVTPARGQTVTVDFPLDAVDPSETGTIFIEVFADTNGNGVRDAGEPGVEGATVYTFELLTTTTNVQVTDNTGITTHPRLIPDVVLAQINHHVLPDGFTGITTVNGGFEYVPVTPQSTTTVSIGLN